MYLFGVISSILIYISIEMIFDYLYKVKKIILLLVIILGFKIENVLINKL